MLIIEFHSMEKGLSSVFLVFEIVSNIMESTYTKVNSNFVNLH